MDTTQQSIRGNRSTLWGILGALAAMIMVLVLATSLAPTASAETPAERCKRETSAYNAAWAAIGKKPPAPYKCGGNNEPPPTLSPTTPEEEPDETAEPTTDTPDSSSGGPDMNAPSERREIEHPDTDGPTIGRTPEATRPSSTGSPKPTKRPSQIPSRRPASSTLKGQSAKVPAVPASVFKNTVDYKKSGNCTGDTYQADNTKWGLLAEGYFNLQYCYGYFDDGNAYYNKITGSVQTSDGLLDKVTYTQGPVDGARNEFRSDMLYWTDNNQGYEAYYFVGIKTCTLFKWAVCPGRNDYYAVGRMSTQGVSWRDGAQ